MTDSLTARVAFHAALADASRLQIVDALALGDLAAGELQSLTGVSSNLLAHHLNVLESAGLVRRLRSTGDGRRTYLAATSAGRTVAQGSLTLPRRVVFVCSANTGRSPLAAASWRRVSDVPATSAGLHPGAQISRGARDVARRHGLELTGARPRALDDVLGSDDLVVTVCDVAHEERPGDLHWSVPPAHGTDHTYGQVLAELDARIGALLPRVQP